MNIAIVYGLNEGPLFSKPLIAELTQRGHDITDVVDADLILAHSGGWLLVDGLSQQATKVALLDPSFHDDRNVAAKFCRRIMYDLSHITAREVPAYGLHRIWNLWYGIRHAITWSTMIRRYFDRDISDFIAKHETVIVRSSDPAWFNAAVLHTGLDIRVLEGDHDTCWKRPAALTDILGL